MNCEVGNQYINIYFFKNGSCRKPEKIRRRKNEIEKIIVKKGKFYNYNDKAIYTLCGENVSSLCKFMNNSPFVLVEPGDCFKPANYAQIFNEFLQDMSNDQCQSCPKMKDNSNRKCQSTPAITARSKISSETRVKFVPCEEEESSEEEFCSNSKPKTPPNRRSSNNHSKQHSTKTKKDGIASLCCVKAEPSQIPSQSFIACGNDKITQTTALDFKCATERMKREIQEQKKREKVYKKPNIEKSGSSTMPPYCPKDTSDDECIDPKVIHQHKAARDQFLKNQAAKAAKIKKSLDKKYGIELKHGLC